MTFLSFLNPFSNKVYGLLFVFSLSLMSVTAQEDPRIKHQNGKNKLAVSGYDVVSYFTKNKARVGKNNLSTTYLGLRYHFSSLEHLNLFKNNPEQYMPQYGGWCAYAMGDSGEKVKIDPGTFKIVDGKLYLFYNFFFNNTLDDWNDDEANLKREADKNWRKLLNK